MAIDHPDPDYVMAPRTRRNFLGALRFSLVCTALVWCLHLLGWVFGLELQRFGLLPQTREGLWGILFTPLLHGSWQHLCANTVPLLVALTAMLFLYPNAALRVIPVIYFGTSIVVWVFGRPDIHIGISGVVYGLLSYIFVAGVLRRDLRSVSVSLLVWFLFSPLLAGLVPTRGPVSWEMHLAGFLLGIVLAWLYREWDRPPLKRYAWEADDDEDAMLPGERVGPSERP
jgi:membrane associated rhomboid family serine protease